MSSWLKAAKATPTEIYSSGLVRKYYTDMDWTMRFHRQSRKDCFYSIEFPSRSYVETNLPTLVFDLVKKFPELTSTSVK